MRLNKRIKPKLAYPYVCYLTVDSGEDDPIEAKTWVINNIGKTKDKVLFWGMGDHNGEIRFKNKIHFLLFEAIWEKNKRRINPEIKEWVNEYVADPELFTEEEKTLFKLTWS